MTVRVLHMTEASAYGVLDVAASMARAQKSVGADVAFAFVRRPDTPTLREVQDRFGEVSDVTELTSGPGLVSRLWSLAKAARSAARSSSYDVIHLHSSWAGVVGRLASLGTRATIVYSPHGWSFLRESTSRTSRRVALLMEILLAKACSRIIVSTSDELRLASTSVRTDHAAILRTGVSHELISREPLMDNPRPVVGMIGRISYQKAPWRFAAVARELSGSARFVWVGGGEQADIEAWFGDAPVEIISWLSQEALASLVQTFDVVLFPSLWEGKPLALMQVQVQGVPAVVSDFGGAAECVVDGKTGFICGGDDELHARTRELVENRELRRSMSEAARDWGAAHLTDIDLGTDSLALYGVGS